MPKHAERLSTQEQCWIGYWSKFLRSGADPRLILSQMQQLVETGKVKQGA